MSVNQLPRPGGGLTHGMSRDTSRHDSPERLPRCRYLVRHLNQCTSEVVDPDGEILLCAQHLARALELIRRGMKTTGITKAPQA